MRLVVEDAAVPAVLKIILVFIAMLVAAQVSPDLLRRWTPWAYLGGMVLLALVLVTGEGEDIVGILRLTDVFAAVFHTLKACKIDD